MRHATSRGNKRSKRACYSFLTENSKILYRYKSQFKSIFKKPLQDYFSLVSGFDIEKFNADLFDGTGRMIDNVRYKYGETADILIQRILTDK